MQTKLTFKQIFQAGSFSAFTAAGINAILFFIFHTAGFITDDIFVQPNTPITVVAILFSSIIPTLVASLVFFLFEKYSNHGFRNFRILAIVLVIASFMNPMMIPGVTMPYAIALNVMHVVVAGSILFYIGRVVKTKV